MSVPRQPLNVLINLDHIHCIDEGDGPGNAEPYLWTLFFKIDGDTVQFEETRNADLFGLKGLITVNRRNGAHGNLNNSDVDADDDVAIPPAIGIWNTVLQPIPIADSIKQLVKDATDPDILDLPGTVGVVCILMEEDNLPDSAAVAGYNAFCSTFETRMNERINSLTFQKLRDSQTPEGIKEAKTFQDEIKKAIQDSITSAIEDDLNLAEAIWNWSAGPDQNLGNASFSFDHDDLIKNTPIALKERWKEGVSVFDPLSDNWIDMIANGPGRFIESGGEWEIYGTVSAAPVPQFIGTFGPAVNFNLEEMAMQDFRKMAETASQEGFTGAFPNFHTATYGRRNIGGTIFLKPGCSTWRDVLLSDLGNPPLNDFGARFRATHLYATNLGFVGGFPNFFHAEKTVFSQTGGSVFEEQVKYGDERVSANSDLIRVLKTPKAFGVKTKAGTGLNKVVVCGTVLIKPGCAEWRDIPLAELGNPSLSDIGARFRATQDYATRNGFVGGFPNFFHADYGNGIVCGTILLTPAAAEWQDVLLWLGPA